MVFGMSFGLDEAGYEREHQKRNRDKFDETDHRGLPSSTVRNCRLTEKIATAKPASPAVFVVVGLKRNQATPALSSCIPEGINPAHCLFSCHGCQSRLGGNRDNRKSPASEDARLGRNLDFWPISLRRSLCSFSLPAPFSGRRS